ncbi:MAG: rRNA maturation RNase YbeY [Burkholderiales bacterium]|nr:rRNA maturation RNase YbeY [Burkholderiales bacterium]
MGSRRPRLSLSVQVAVQAHAVPARAQLRQWAGAALERDAEVTLRIVDAPEGRRLNAQFRGKDHPTNVLTFTYGEPIAPDMPLAGDIVLCAPVVEAEAESQAKSMAAHYAHLVVHGMLHLQGYDHEADDDAQRMEARERALMTQLGFPDPYAPAPRAA